jgi:hypothetical protein
MDVDTSLAGPAVYVAHTNGSISLCSASEVLSVNKEASGSPLIAASIQDGVLFTVHSTRGSTSGALLGRFTSVGPKLRCDTLQPITAPTDGAVPVAAVHAMGRAVVLWSDGCIAAYDDLNRTGEAAYTRKLKEFANLDIDKSTASAEKANKKAAGKKKRGLANGSDASGSSGKLSAPAALIDAGDGVVVVAGWSSTYASSLRFVAIDAIFGAIQCATNLSSGDVLGAATAKLDAKNSIQVRLYWAL